MTYFDGELLCSIHISIYLSEYSPWCLSLPSDLNSNAGQLTGVHRCCDRKVPPEAEQLVFRQPRRLRPLGGGHGHALRPCQRSQQLEVRPRLLQALDRF